MEQVERFLRRHQAEIELAVCDAVAARVPWTDIVVIAVDPDSPGVPSLYEGSEVGTMDRCEAIEEFSSVVPDVAASLRDAPQPPACHVVAIVDGNITVSRIDVEVLRHLA